MNKLEYFSCDFCVPCDDATRLELIEDALQWEGEIVSGGKVYGNISLSRILDVSLQGSTSLLSHENTTNYVFNDVYSVEKKKVSKEESGGYQKKKASQDTQKRDPSERYEGAKTVSADENLETSTLSYENVEQPLDLVVVLKFVNCLYEIFGTQLWRGKAVFWIQPTRLVSLRGVWSMSGSYRTTFELKQWEGGIPYTKIALIGDLQLSAITIQELLSSLEHKVRTNQLLQAGECLLKCGNEVRKDGYRKDEGGGLVDLCKNLLEFEKGDLFDTLLTSLYCGKAFKLGFSTYLPKFRIKFHQSFGKTEQTFFSMLRKPETFYRDVHKKISETFNLRNGSRDILLFLEEGGENAYLLADFDHLLQTSSLQTFLRELEEESTKVINYELRHELGACLCG